MSQIKKNYIGLYIIVVMLLLCTGCAKQQPSKQPTAPRDTVPAKVSTRRRQLDTIAIDAANETAVPIKQVKKATSTPFGQLRTVIPLTVLIVQTTNRKATIGTRCANIRQMITTSLVLMKTWTMCMIWNSIWKTINLCLPNSRFWIK